MITMQLAEDEVLRERERCAKIAKQQAEPAMKDKWGDGYNRACQDIAAAILRGE